MTRFWKAGLLTLLALISATPIALSAHPGHEPASAGALAAKFHALLGVSPGIALAVVGIVALVVRPLVRPTAQPD